MTPVFWIEQEETERTEIFIIEIDGLPQMFTSSLSQRRSDLNNYANSKRLSRLTLKKALYYHSVQTL
jgi:hypothetical protein